MSNVIPFPPKTYAEARAYYAGADLSNAILTTDREAERRKSVEIAQKMKADNMPFDIIAKYTGLTPAEIEKL